MAIFLAIFPLVIIGLCFHAAMVGGPIMDDDTWFLTKVLFCVLAPFAAALTVGIFSKGSLASAWAKEHCPDSIRPGNPPAPERACASDFDHALGLDSSLGKKPFDCNGHDQCEIGDSRDEACVP